MRRYLVPLIFGLGGFAILVSLGLWQLRRLEWKEARLAEIDTRIMAAPQPIGAIDRNLPPDDLRYAPVTMTGRTTGQEVLVLTSVEGQGPGYRVIAGFVTDTGQRVMLDRGFIADAASAAPRPPVALTVTGNLHWPDETDSYTPPPDPVTGIWFARDVPKLALDLATQDLLVIASGIDGDTQGITALPLTSAAVRNNHQQYAITWFLLAFGWLGMTAFLLWRIRQQRI